MRSRMFPMLTLFLLLFAALNYYVGYHLWMYLSFMLRFGDSTIFWILFWIVTFSYVIGRAGTRFIGRPAAHLLRQIGSIWFGVLEYSVLLLPLADLLSVILRAGGMPTEDVLKLLGSIVFVLLIALLAWGTYNAWNPVVRRYNIHIPKNGGGRERLHIAMASDIHLGTIVGNKHLGRLQKVMDALKPDLILLPGDIIDDDIEPFVREKMSSGLARLTAPLGVYAVLGNHDYYGGHVQQLVKELQAINIRTLQDEHVLIDNSFYVIGRKDRTAETMEPGGRFAVEALTAAVDKSRPVILMDHQPHHLDKASEAGIDLMLSGHTHRGQMAPNHLITRRIFELDWGYLLKGGMHAIVSSGFGTWGPPIRLGSRSEVIDIRISFGTEPV
ncbi:MULTISPECIES: metallophosphoesterase [Paenibacillus]|uniref:metallophosphoesterase n=1 Tax=Paenibacillus TaxID=44249 RepID=UPI0022B8FBE3|nr:metallophosphoesterase [Paenibacillus caseinilyticus]MCZ8522440.1 metallophosphoesterase [Paenibacillus caseinilyticus]